MSFRRKHKDNFFVDAYLYAEYCAFRVVTVFLLSLNVRTALKMGALLGNLVSIIDRTHTKRTYKHIRMAYKNELSEAKIRAIAKGVYEHFGQVFTEILFFRRLIRKYTWHKYLSYENENYLKESLAKNKGVILVGGHMGNWEISGCILMLCGYKVASIARPLDNPYVDKFLNSFRTQTGQNIIEKWGAMKGTLRALKDNQIVGMLVDQDARKNGIFVDFFGLPSSTLPIPAQLALKYKAVILPFNSYRAKKNDIKYVLSFYPPLDVKPTNNFENDVRALTQQVASCIEKTIRMHPDQWLWMHRRWKTKPGPVIRDPGAGGRDPRAVPMKNEE